MLKHQTDMAVFNVSGLHSLDSKPLLRLPSWLENSAALMSESSNENIIALRRNSSLFLNCLYLSSNYLLQKLTAILFFTSLCFALLGYHLVFNFQLATIKSEMKAFLKTQKEHEGLVQFSWNEQQARQLFWENKNEFRYNDEMYDVVETKNVKGQLIIRCIPDNKETELLNEYQKNNKHNSVPSTIVQLITTQFDLPVDYSIKQPEKIIKNYFTDHSSSLQTIASTIVAPPPDVC